MRRFVTATISCAVLLLLISSCGGGHAASGPAAALSNGVYPAGVESPGATWPVRLPVDTPQPWEQLDSFGKVVPPADGRRSASGINADSEFVAGVERFLEGPGATDDGEATKLSSAAAPVSYAIYRIPLGGAEPGVVSVDANLLSGSAYYVGLADYGRDAWAWHGPFSDNHVRLSTANDGHFTSGLGNVFVCTAVCRGAAADVVGIGVNPIDSADHTPPPAPAAPEVTPVRGGLLLQWLPVVAGDLAGYRIYYAGQSFDNGSDAGVRVEQGLEGLTGHLLGGLELETYVRISAVDISGNESELSESTVGTPLEGPAGSLTVGISAPSVQLNEPVVLTAGGADSYDFDLDGDGLYEISGTTTETANVDTSGTGIVRPRVRGTSGGGEAVALGGVSLIVSSFSRPVAVATAVPASGAAPLSVDFSGADSTDFDGAIVGGGWDFDGDGTYDVWEDADLGYVTSAEYSYATPGVYNAKLRVVDDDGAWDVDTLAIVVGDTANQPPTAALEADVTSGDAPLPVSFNASGSADADGAIVEYAWDWEGDGQYDATTDVPTADHTYTTAGSPEVKVRVEDDAGARATATLTVTVNVTGNELPVADLLATPDSGAPPLTVTLDASGSSDADGSIINYEWDFDGDGTYDSYGAVDSVEYTYTATGDFTAKVRVTDDAGAQATATDDVTVGAAGNQAPVAVLYGSPLTGEDAIDVAFSAADSYDPDGTIEDYEWDFDGDGNFNETGAEEDNQGEAAPELQTYTAGYPVIARVRVTDSDGAVDTAALTVTVHGWGKIVVDSDGSTGTHTSLAVVDGNPAISYYYSTSQDLKYVRATDAQGGGWGTPVAVDTGGTVGQYTSLAVVNGNPAISYYDFTNKDLKYVRASNATGSAWGTPVAVDTGGDVGQYTSLAVVDGNPAISYYDFTNKDLKYVRASNATGSAWGTPVAVDSTGYVGLYTSLAVVNGNPAISYYDGVNFDLDYVRATNASGSSWGTPVAIDTTGDVGDYNSLAVVDGNPAISYRDFSNSDLKYVRATDASGSSWDTPVAVDTGGNVGMYSSLAVVDGYPAISYYDFTNTNLKYVQATDAGGSTWDTPVTVDSDGVTGQYTSLAMVSGEPAISYYAVSNSDLMFATVF